jgi:hypothetical protein
MLIKTSDRNLALLLGRALDAQKFFHDVNYEYRLRDSTTELYQFRDPINVRPISEALDSPMQSDSAFELHQQGKEPIEENILPNGVFTLLTDCYSPTCTSEKLCYSAYCPRRQEQVLVIIVVIMHIMSL